MHSSAPTSSPHIQAAVTGLRGEVHWEVPLRKWTSLKIGGPAEALIIPEDVEDLRMIITQAHALEVPWLVLGGTNVLVRDGGLRGLVISLSKFQAIQEENEDLIYAEAGVRMPLLLQFAVSRSLSGLEWAAGIPGTVGGGVVMNAGTHLGEMKDVLAAIRFVTLHGNMVKIPSSEIPFSYRSASLPAGVVVGAWFQLTKTSQKTVDSAMKHYLRYRKQTQPLTRPNAGSVFKNPPGASAGRLIEEAGLKGTRIGDAQISQKHGNFIVNIGEARATDVLLLIKKVQQAVFQRNGIMLELEVKVIGDP